LITLALQKQQFSYCFHHNNLFSPVSFSQQQHYPQQALRSAVSLLSSATAFAALWKSRHQKKCLTQAYWGMIRLGLPYSYLQPNDLILLLLGQSFITVKVNFFLRES
jgi:hypothetical protein